MAKNKKNRPGGKGNKKAGRNKDKAAAYRKRKGIPEGTQRSHSGKKRPKTPEALLNELSKGKPEVKLEGGGWSVVSEFKPFYVEELDKEGNFIYSTIERDGELRNVLSMRKISTPEELLEFQGGNLDARRYFINLFGTEQLYGPRIVFDWSEFNLTGKLSWSTYDLTPKDKESLVEVTMRRKGFGKVVEEEKPISLSVSTMLQVRQRTPEQIYEERFIGLTKTERKALREAERQAAKIKRAEDLSEAVANFDRVKQLKTIQDEPIQAKIAQAQANIRQAQVASQVSDEVPGRITQSTASMIQQDSFRAASVLHSSKMGYAAVGAAAIMGLAGYNTLTGRKRRIQQDLERG